MARASFGARYQMHLTAERLGGVTRAAERAGYSIKAIKDLSLLALHFQVKPLGARLNGKRYYSFRLASPTQRAYVTGNIGHVQGAPRQSTITGLQTHAEGALDLHDQPEGWERLEDAFTEDEALAILQAFAARMTQEKRRAR